MLIRVTSWTVVEVESLRSQLCRKCRDCLVAFVLEKYFQFLLPRANQLYALMG